MNERSKQMIAQALRLLAAAVEHLDEPYDQPVEPQRLLDQDRVEREKTRAEMKRRGLL